MKKATRKTENPKEQAKRLYERQLEQLHELVWRLDCYHVNELNRIKEEDVNFGNCGFIGSVIEKLQEIANQVEGKEQ